MRGYFHSGRRVLHDMCVLGRVVVAHLRRALVSPASVAATLTFGATDAHNCSLASIVVNWWDETLKGKTRRPFACLVLIFLTRDTTPRARVCHRKHTLSGFSGLLMYPR